MPAGAASEAELINGADQHVTAIGAFAPRAEAGGSERVFLQGLSVSWERSLSLGLLAAPGLARIRRGSLRVFLRGGRRGPGGETRGPRPAQGLGMAQRRARRGQAGRLKRPETPRPGRRGSCSPQSEARSSAAKERPGRTSERRAARPDWPDWERAGRPYPTSRAATDPRAGWRSSLA